MVWGGRRRVPVRCGPLRPGNRGLPSRRGGRPSRKLGWSLSSRCLGRRSSRRRPRRHGGQSSRRRRGP